MYNFNWNLTRPKINQFISIWTWCLAYFLKRIWICSGHVELQLSNFKKKVFVKTRIRTETDVHFLEVWETERNLDHKWLPLRITKETLTFERYFLPKAVLSNASLLYMTRSDVFVCEAGGNKNICHVNEIYFCEFYPM